MSDFLPQDLASTYPLVKDALSAFAPTIRKNAGGIARALIDRTVANLQIGFAPYLNTSYLRCKSVKTLLSQDRPLDLLDIYVHLYLQCKSDTVADDDLIGDLAKYNRIVVTGLAGCGKSLFLKYLTVSRFQHPRGTIPVFVELRQLNRLTSKDLLTYIHKECASAGNKVTYPQFELALQSGGIALFLDGFDEIDYSHRDTISRQILAVATKYPEVPIVVSSRPDDKFGAWQNFYVFTICPLKKAQVLELIDKIDYDSDLKKRFKVAVERELFQSHNSFLSSPLLSSIMLLTYEQFAEIPTKRHIFYEEAFNALFRRHDATKAQFVRKTYANLALDDFRSFFAGFCALSYFDEKFSFLDQELDHYVGQSLKFYKMSLETAENIIRDLRECVCMLQKDGLYTTFVHRSFQEYFSASFLASYNGPLVPSMIDKCARRGRDEVLPMLFEMARDKLDREWAIPRINRFLSVMNELSDKIHASAQLYKKLVNFIGIEITLTKSGKLRIDTPRGDLGEEYEILEWLFKLYAPLPNPGRFRRDPMFEKVVHECFMESFKNWLGISSDSRFVDTAVDNKLGMFDDVKKNKKPSNLWTWRFAVEMNDDIAEKIGLLEKMRPLCQDLAGIKKKIEEELRGRDSIVSLLLEENGGRAPDGRNGGERRPRATSSSRLLKKSLPISRVLIP